jgi:hypothetical protein
MQGKDQLSFSIKIVLLKITDKIDLGKRSYDNFSKVHYNFNINIQSDVIKSAPTNWKYKTRISDKYLNVQFIKIHIEVKNQCLIFRQK